MQNPMAVVGQFAYMSHMGGPADYLALLILLWLCAVLAAMVAHLIILVFYCLTMQKALTLAGSVHRTLEPGLVWLLFIPLFGSVWDFFVVKHVSDSVKRWATTQGREVGDGGRAIGLTACILNCCCLIPFFGIPCQVGWLVCMILWWVKVAKLNKLMVEGQAGAGVL